MMSQNRQATKDRPEAGRDYEVKGRAEIETATARKMDFVRAREPHALWRGSSPARNLQSGRACDSRRWRACERPLTIESEADRIS